MRDLETATDLDRLELELDDDYYALIPDDSFLVGVFERSLAAIPNDFAPVGDQF